MGTFPIAPADVKPHAITWNVRERLVECRDVLRDDPHEQQNLAASEPETAARLRANLVAWRKAVDAEGHAGWSLSFDPHFWEKFERLDPVAMVKGARSPLAIIRGAKSQLFQTEDAAYLLSLIAPDSPCVEIPEAEHHVMIDQPLSFVAALRGLLSGWPR